MVIAAYPRENPSLPYVGNQEIVCDSGVRRAHAAPRALPGAGGLRGSAAPAVEPPPTAFRSAWRPSGEAIAFAEEVLRADAAGRGDPALLAAWAYHSLLWRCQADLAGPAQATDDEDPVVLAEHWMEGRLHEDLAVSDLARAAGCSPGHLHECFRARRGVTPMAAVWEQRLQRLREELVADDAPLDELAPRFGFADAAHLCRRFKARFGTTTGALRRVYRRREA